MKNIDQDDNQKSFLRGIDLNCDLAQGWGTYKHSQEEALLPFVSSVNIACGAHAGDPNSITQALKLAKEYSLSVGAHIGYPDLAGFGRREVRLDPDELQACITSQLGLLAGMARSQGITLTHVRPHGAMYYRCANDNLFAENIAKAVASFSSWLTFVGPIGNYLNLISDVTGLKTVGEVHLDKPYRRDATLHKSPNALRMLPFDFACAQARSLLFQNKLIVEGGRRLRVAFRTVHLSMDKPYSLQLAEYVSNLLKKGPLAFDGVSRVEDIQVKDFVAPSRLSEYFD